MAMTAIVKEVVDSQQKSDRMFSELEEKCMKFRRRRERISYENDDYVVWQTA